MWGGVIYNLLGLPFQSPTINLFIEGDNFAKLVENLEYYMSMPAKPLVDNYIDPQNPSIHYPKILCGDIEICALHYRDCEDAVTAWERRRARVNLNNVFVIGNSWNSHENSKLVQRILQCGYPSVAFCYDDWGYDKCIQLDKELWQLDERGIVRPDITARMNNSSIMYFERMFDFVGWLNGANTADISKWKLRH